ncbi:MAG: beta-ketoacyl-ACP synthase II [Planctomycetaceae bacterium]
MSRRVVVTGISVITSLGCEIAEFWDRICAGKSGVSRLKRFDCTDFKVQFGGEVAEFSAKDHISIRPNEVKRLDRFAQFALVGADKAIAHSGIDFDSCDLCRCGVVTGSGIGGLSEIEKQHSVLFDRGPRRVSAYMIPKLMANAASGNISVRWRLQGPNSAVATACASATNAIGDAFRIIQMDAADVMVTGGCEAALTPMGLSGFARMNALSVRNDDPASASRPFDRGRDGFVLSEGAGLIVLEERGHALRRDAPILAEVLGYGMSADGSHMTAPDPTGTGAARAMKAALKDARVNPEDIDYINAHGTSTPLGDVAETTGIKSVFGDHAKRLCVSSTKSQLGHLLGASGGVEVATCVMAMNNKVVPPTINLDDPDDGCDLDYVANDARPVTVKRVLKNSFGFGGHNACLVLGSVE